MENNLDKPVMKVVGCFMEYEEKFLMLLRHPEKSSGNQWGLPGGKIEEGETKEAAIIREIQEETGYTVEALPTFVGEWRFHFPEGIIIDYATFKIALRKKVPVVLDPTTHVDTHWFSAEECWNLPNKVYGIQELLQYTNYVKETPVR